VGKNITLQYYYKNFPYYTTDRYFNLDTHSPVSEQLLKRLLNSPTATVKTLLDLLVDETSYFNKLAVGVMQMNASTYPESIFVYEFGLLQGLAKYSRVSGKIFTKENNPIELEHLEEFSSEISKLLKEKYPDIAGALEKKVDVTTLNGRGVTKEQIRLFLQGFDNPRIKHHEQNVDTWNTLRSKTTTAHGGSIDITDKTFSKASKDLHELLLEIMSKEVEDRFNTEKNV
jgi:hypothetical protein